MGKQIKELTARLAMDGTDMVPMQGANDLNYYGTVAQIAAYTCGAEEACDTAGATADKAVTLTTETVPPVLAVTFAHGNTYGDTTASTPTNPTLTITTSDSTTHTYDICDSRGHIAGTGCWNDGDRMVFAFAGSKAIITNSDIRQAVMNYTIKSDGNSNYYQNGEQVGFVSTARAGLSGYITLSSKNMYFTLFTDRIFYPNSTVSFTNLKGVVRRSTAGYVEGSIDEINFFSSAYNVTVTSVHDNCVTFYITKSNGDAWNSVTNNELVLGYFSELKFTVSY